MTTPRRVNQQAFCANHATHPFARLKPQADDITYVLVGHPAQCWCEPRVPLDTREAHGDEDGVDDEVKDTAEHGVGGDDRRDRVC